MFLFKFMFSLSLLMSDAPKMDADGWVPVERPKQEAEMVGADERDPSIWVVFAKQIGSEKIILKFPDEPTYRYAHKNGEEMEVTASAFGVEHKFQVVPQTYASSEEMLRQRVGQLEGYTVISQKWDENSAEWMGWKDDFWVQEKIIRGEFRTFFLQTKSASIEANSHRAFVESFDLEIDPKF